MSHPNPNQQQQSPYQPPLQNGLPYQHPYYPTNGHQEPQTRDPQMQKPINTYTDPRLVSGHPPPSPPQSNMAHQQLPQQGQHGYNLHPQQLQQIIMPPPAPGNFQDPNGSPFTTVPLRQTTTSPPPPVRFLCDKCGITFSRQYDRNRHYESTHSENPPVHQCERCMKQFSRADAKKRHQDGKCLSSP